MNPEELREMKELVEFLKENGIGEFDLERGDLKVRIKFVSEHGSTDLAGLSRLLSSAPHAAAHTTQAAPPVGSVAVSNGDDESREPADKQTLHIVKSPIVGTFYESPSPGTSPFVNIGDQVENGQVLCIIEAMKLMNEIESDAAGEIVRRFVQTGQPIEYGQPLFALRLS